MKYVLALLLCSALALCCMLPGLCEPADGGEAPAEWTLLFYFCGTDLESKHGLATSSLEDMTKATPLELYDVPDAHIDPIQWDQIEASGKINVVIETGGCSHWRNSNQINLIFASSVPKSANGSIALSFRKKPVEITFEHQSREHRIVSPGNFTQQRKTTRLNVPLVFINKTKPEAQKVVANVVTHLLAVRFREKRLPYL